MIQLCVCVYIYIYIYLLFQIIFHYKLLQDIEYSSLHYIAGPCLSILFVVVCIYLSHTPSYSIPLSPCFPFGIHKFIFFLCELISAL